MRAKRKEPIINKIIEDFANNAYEDSKCISLNQLKEKNEVESYFYDELHENDVNGFPIASEFVDSKGNSYDMNDYDNLSDKIKKELRLKYYYLPNLHELYVGTTGSGKTTGCVEPQVRALVSQKNKPNIIITDPKGEIFNRNAEYIKKNGYQVFVLNFKDVSRSDRWNPLQEIYDSHMRLKEYMSPTKEIKKQDKKFFYDGRKFNNEKAVSNYIDQQIESINSETDSMVKQFVQMIIPIQSKNDITWEQGAQSIGVGILYSMLEFALDPEAGFTEDMFSLKTFFEFYEKLRDDLAQGDDLVSFDELLNHPLVDRNEKIANKLKLVFTNSEKTKRNYLGVFDGHMAEWAFGHIFSITTGNTIKFENLDKPFVIFVITRDYEKSDFRIAGLFIDYVYRTLLDEAEKKMLEGKNPPIVHFMLDEFGNIPKIPSFDNKIATSRSRNIWMHLFLQSYEQMYNVYTDKAEADVILSNCNSRIFLGSQSYNTIETFSRECGRKTVNIGDITDYNTINLVETSVLRKSDLDLIKVGSMYMKRIYYPVINTHYIRSYYLGDLGFYKLFEKDGLLKCTPKNNIVWSSNKYTFKLKESIIKKNKEKSMFDDLF